MISRYSDRLGSTGQSLKDLMFFGDWEPMGIFVCDECSAIENTSSGWYHCTNAFNLRDNAKKGKKLCCQCCPEFFSDGSRITKHKAEWHNHFPRTVATEESLLEYGIDEFVYLGKFEYLKKGKNE